MQVFVGEVGLTGTVLAASQLDRRLSEAVASGFQVSYVGERPGSSHGASIPRGSFGALQIQRIRNVADLVPMFVNS